MTPQKLLLIIAPFYIALTAVIAYVLVQRTKRKTDPEAYRKYALKMRKTFLRLKNNKLVGPLFNIVVEEYSSLQAFDSDTLYLTCVEAFKKTAWISAIPFLLITVLFRQTFLSVLSLLISVTVFRGTIRTEAGKVRAKVYTELSSFLGVFRAKFLETNSIPEALNRAEKTPYVKATMDSLYEILKGADDPLAYQKFYASAPLPIEKTFAIVCRQFHRSGIQTASDGLNALDKIVLILRQEINGKVAYIERSRQAFSSLSIICLVGCAVSPACEIFLRNMIPGTTAYIDGIWGMITHIVLILATTVGYYYITQLSDTTRVAENDTSKIFQQIIMDPKLDGFFYSLRSRSPKARKFLENLRNDSLTQKSTSYIYLQKVIFSGLGCILSVLALLLSTITMRSMFKHNYSSLSFIPMAVTETRYNQMVRMDDDFLNLNSEEVAKYRDEESGDANETLQNYVKSRLSGAAQSDVNDQAARLLKKYDYYHNSVPRWWWGLIVVAVTGISWFIPEGVLTIRKKVVAFELSEDVAQLQTLLAVFSYTRLDVYEVLLAMEQLASVHKASIRRAHVRYCNDPKKALEELAQKSPSLEFKRLINKLSAAIQDLSLEDALADISIEKSQSLEMAALERNEMLDKKRLSAKTFAIAPSAIALVGSYLGPVGLLAVSSLAKTFATLSGGLN